MIKSEIASIISSAFDNCSIPSSEVPDIDLYMDQILTLVHSTKGQNEEKSLTKTMINNYTKEKLLKPVKGKKYSRQHILFMLLVYNLKSVLTIEDIKMLIDYCDAAVSDETGSYKKDELIKLYDECYKKYDDISRSLTNFIDGFIKDTESELDMFENVLTLCAISSIAKKSAEQLIKALSTEK